MASSMDGKLLLVSALRAAAQWHGLDKTRVRCRVAGGTRPEPQLNLASVIWKDDHASPFGLISHAAAPAGHPPRSRTGHRRPRAGGDPRSTFDGDRLVCLRGCGQLGVRKPPRSP